MSTYQNKYLGKRASLDKDIIAVLRQPLELLEMFLVLAHEAGGGTNRSLKASSDEPDYIFEVLSRLHARGCLIGSEVLALLQSGHANGAHAR